MVSSPIGWMFDWSGPWHAGLIDQATMFEGQPVCKARVWQESRLWGEAPSATEGHLSWYLHRLTAWDVFLSRGAVVSVGHWGGERTQKGVGYSSSSSARAQREVGGHWSRPDRSLSLRVIICGDIFNLVVPELRCWVSQVTIRAILRGKHSTRRSISYQLRVQKPPPAMWERGKEWKRGAGPGRRLTFSSVFLWLFPSRAFERQVNLDMTRCQAG